MSLRKFTVEIYSERIDSISMKNLLKGLGAHDISQIVIMLGNKVGSGVVGYLMFVLIARFLGAHDFGVFSALFSAAMMTGMVGSFGQQAFLVKQNPIRNDFKLREFDSNLYRFSIVSSFVVALACSCGLFLYARISLGTQEDWIILSMAMVLSVAFAGTQATIGGLRTVEKVQVALFTRDFIWRVLICLGIGLLIFLHIKEENRLRLTMLVVAGILFLIYAFHLHLLFGSLKKMGRSSPKPVHWRAWLETSAGLCFVAVISGSDTFIFTLTANGVADKTGVGAFFASMRTIEALNLFLMSITLVYANKMSLAAANFSSRARDLQSLCNTLMIIQVVPVAVCGAIIVAFNKEILSLFGEQYSGYSYVLIALTIGVLANALTGSTGLLMQMLGMHWQQVVLQGGALLIGLAVGIIFNKNIGLLSICFGYVFAKISWNIFAVILIKKKCGVDPSIGALLGSNLIGRHEVLKDFKSELKRGRA